MKKKVNIYWFVIIIAGLFSGCEKEIELELPVHQSIVVVEGWIEQNKYPEVILSLSSPYFSSIDSLSILDYAVRSAKVTIYTDDDSEILLLSSNDKYFPPQVYRARRIKGEVGKTYNIEVLFRGDTITASTTIPEPVAIDSFWFELAKNQDSLGYLYFSITDNPNQKNYYRTLTRVQNQEELFVPTRMSVYDDKYFNGEEITFTMAREASSWMENSMDHYFKIGDTVDFKLCSIDKASYDFWNTYQNEILSSANPFASTNARIKCNINHGYGVWYGSGVTFSSKIIK